MIPLGYFIVRKSGKKPRPSGVSPDYLTVAGCLCEGVIPGLESAPFDGEEIAREWDLSPHDASNASRLVQIFIRDPNDCLSGIPGVA